MRFRLCLLAFVFVLPGCAKAQGDLADRAASQLRAALPGYEIDVVDGMTLKVTSSSHGSEQINLDRVQQYCANNPANCDAMLATYVAKIVPLIKTQDAPPNADRLWATVRSAGYVAGLQQQIGSTPDAKLLTAPLAGDLTLVCEFDLPTATRPAFAADLRKISVPASSVIALCRKNMDAHLPALDPQLYPLDPHTLGILQGDGYTSSQFIFPERWAAYAAKYKSGLIVAVPADNVMLYGRDDGPEDEGALREYAQHIAQTAERPISDTVFRWTPAGWTPVGK